MKKLLILLSILAFVIIGCEEDPTAVDDTTSGYSADDLPECLSDCTASTATEACTSIGDADETCDDDDEKVKANRVQDTDDVECEREDPEEECEVAENDDTIEEGDEWGRQEALWDEDDNVADVGAELYGGENGDARLEDEDDELLLERLPPPFLLLPSAIFYRVLVGGLFCLDQRSDHPLIPRFKILEFPLERNFEGVNVDS